MIDHETIEEVQRMHGAGATISQIGRALNMKLQAVRYCLRRRLPKPSENTVVVRSVVNGGWSTSPLSVSYISLPRVRFLEAANDNIDLAASAA